MTKEFLDNLQDKLVYEDVEAKLFLTCSEAIPITHPAIFELSILDKNESFSKSMNLSLSKAKLYSHQYEKFDYYCIIGNDGFPQQKDWLKKLVEGQKEKGCAIMCPNHDKPGLHMLKHHVINQDDTYVQVRMFPAICWLITSDVFFNIGYFDETFIPGCYEDDDYARRVRNDGGTIYVRKDVMITHRLSQTLGKMGAGEAMSKNLQRYREKWKE